MEIEESQTMFGGDDWWVCLNREQAGGYGG